MVNVVFQAHKLSNRSYVNAGDLLIIDNDFSCYYILVISK